MSVIHDAIRRSNSDIVHAVLTEESRRPESELSIADYRLADTSGNSEIHRMSVES